MKYTTDKSGEVIDSQVIHPGSRGDDLVLSIDIDLQKKTEEYLEKQISKLRSEGAKNMDNALVVVQNPNNGDILAMACKQIDKNGYLTDYDIGNFTSQYAVGSSVKGGTLLAGYQNDAIKVGEEMVDEPLTFSGGLSKRSYFNQDGKVTIDDKEALMHSSNVYMIKTALKIAGSPYTPNMSLPTDISEAGQKLRKGLNQVGLGVKTGIDLPNETSGQIEPLTDNPGNFLDLSIGQYDTYTPLQLSQYVSTIANNGYRIQPHIGLEIRKATNKDTLGPVKEKVKGNVLNKVNNTSDQIKQVQEGFKMAFNEKEGTGYQSFNDTTVPSAGKTGTAQVADSDNGGYVEGENPYFVSFIGDAPKDDPEVIVYAGMSLAQKNDQEAYEMGVSKAFNPIMENTLKYLNVGEKDSKDGSDVKYSKVPDVQGQETQKAQDKMNSKSLEPIVIGSGDKVVKQSVTSDKEVLPNSKVLLLTDGDITMPDMTGWTKEEVLAFETLTNTKITTKGSGFVSEQSEAKGQKVSKNDKIEVTFTAEKVNGESSSSSSNNDSEDDDKDDSNKDDKNE